MSAPEVLGLLQEALAHHQGGRLDKAEALYNHVLEAEPENADAFNLLGSIAFGRGQLANAKRLYHRAIAARPQMAGAYFNLANLLMASGEVAEALAAYDRATELQPDFTEAHLNRGVLLRRVGSTDAAIAAFESAARAAPADVRGHLNLGQCLKEAGRLDAAVASFGRVLEREPQHFEAHRTLAEIWTSRGRVQDAVRHTKAAIAIRPTPESYSNLGDLLRRTGDLAGALDAHRRALAEKPDDPVIHHNYGATLLDAGALAEAENAFAHALARNADFLPAYHGRAKVREREGRTDDAIAALKQGLVRAPGDPDLVFQLALRELNVGRLEEGWAHYEARFHTTDRRQSKRPTPPPYWQGEDIAGKSILVWMEQGVGDEVLYAGMLADVVARAGRCTIACAPRLVPVFARSFPNADVRTAGDAGSAYDYQCAAASLGGILRKGFADFPRRKAYLKADAARTAELRARYCAVTPGNLVVGISWRSTNTEIGALKNADLGLWHALLKTPGVTFVSLQYGDWNAELAETKRSIGVDIVQDAEIDQLREMDGFFAQVAAVDLAIGTSNSAVHVAGSLGVPTWLLLPTRSGGLWYWFHGRSDSPWYPSLRILQPLALTAALPTLWADVLSRATDDLKALITQHRAGSRV